MMKKTIVYFAHLVGENAVYSDRISKFKPGDTPPDFFDWLLEKRASIPGGGIVVNCKIIEYETTSDTV